MASGGSGRFPSFEPRGEQKWTLHYQRFLFHCQIRKIEQEADRKAELMSISSDEMFEFVRAVCRREVHDEALTFTGICTAIEEHLSPQPNEILAASKFHMRAQQANESVTEFVTDLRRLARPANFGACFDRMVRDRLVIGLANQEAKALLFRIKDLSLDKATETALSVEAANNNVSGVADLSTSVNYVNTHGRSQGRTQGPSQPQAVDGPRQQDCRGLQQV